MASGRLRLLLRYKLMSAPMGGCGALKGLNTSTTFSPRLRSLTPSEQPLARVVTFAFQGFLHARFGWWESSHLNWISISGSGQSGEAQRSRVQRSDLLTGSAAGRHWDEVRRDPNDDPGLWVLENAAFDCGAGSSTWASSRLDLSPGRLEAVNRGSGAGPWARGGRQRECFPQSACA